MPHIIEIKNLTHSYQKKIPVLNNLSLDIEQGEIFGLLGPNGSGKSTLFKILSTLLFPTKGSILFEKKDLLNSREEVRKHIGVVFQNPSLDKKLSVFENLIFQGYLYGLKGKKLTQKINTILEKLDLITRKNDKVEILSGGLKRRVEIAKCLLHNPKILILDEPTTGLDPSIRASLWKDIFALKQEGMTCLITTHLMDEAEFCDRIGILDKGYLMALDTPSHLKKNIGGEVVTFKSKNINDLSQKLKKTFSCSTKILDDELRAETNNGSDLLTQALKTFPQEIESVTLSKPTLGDVFIQKTGHSLEQ
ncbi:MAG: ABC transporter ATP-binding protein [Deltaproteobacteria bacterium]|nr:ABC transporter ATP-binding protein [Deltaproteobacteria bacterium]